MGSFFSFDGKGCDGEDFDVPTCPLKVVMISDTHNDHRSITVPDGDILIHGGDFTSFGKIEHANDFNEWLGTLPHKYKIVVNGNHESNAPWKNQTKEILSNATFLRQESVVVYRDNGTPVKIYGTEFCWPVLKGGNPYYNQIDMDTNILISHGPANGFVDGQKGCPTLRQRCSELNDSLKLVIGGHIHFARGSCMGSGDCVGIRFVNASICGSGRKAVNEPIVLEV